MGKKAASGREERRPLYQMIMTRDWGLLRPREKDGAGASQSGHRGAAKSSVARLVLHPSGRKRPKNYWIVGGDNFDEDYTTMTLNELLNTISDLEKRVAELDKNQRPLDENAQRELADLKKRFGEYNLSSMLEDFRLLQERVTKLEKELHPWKREMEDGVRADLRGDAVRIDNLKKAILALLDTLARDPHGDTHLALNLTEKAKIKRLLEPDGSNLVKEVIPPNN
jgi:hypothetical protein